jgi:hypothetical protein
MDNWDNDLERFVYLVLDIVIDILLLMALILIILVVT